MNNFLIVIVVIAIGFFALYFTFAKYNSYDYDVLVNKSGVYRIDLKEEGFFDMDQVLPHFFGSKTNRKPNIFHSKVVIKKFDFHFKISRTDYFDCGKGPSLSSLKNLLIFKDFLLLEGSFDFHLYDNSGKLIRNFLEIGMFENPIIVDYVNNSFCFINKSKDKFYLNIVFLNDMRKNIKINLEKIYLDRSYEVMDYSNGRVLISIYDKDRGKLTIDEDEKIIPKSYLCYIENNKVQYDELPVDAENPQMFASAIGKDFFVFYDSSQKGIFSYKVYDLKSSKFSEKYQIKLGGISDYQGNFYFNKENNKFLTYLFEGGVTAREVLIFDLYSTTGKTIPLYNLK